jgi:hypothetical protein
MSKRSIRYFVSYTRDDTKLPEKLLSELKKKLGADADYDFKLWQDTEIPVGKNWHDEIQAALSTCDFGLLLVSPAFLGKKYITAEELPPFVRGTKPCVPVTLSRIDFEEMDLKGLDPVQFFSFTPPRDSRPRSFEECSSVQHRSAFAHRLYLAIKARLDELFALAASEAAPASASVGGLDEASYRAHIRKHYRHLQLEALGGDAIYRDIELQQIFIPQDARDCREWIPEKLESPADLTLGDATDDGESVMGETSVDVSLAELHEQKRFRATKPRRVFDVMDPPAVRCRVLLGAPGAGKSSFTQICLLRWLAEEPPLAGPVPILIELRLFHRSGRTDFLDFLENDKDVVFRFPRDFLSTQLLAGRAELLFDGLDEIFDPIARTTVARLIAAYSELFPQARILVTSRLIGYPGAILRRAEFAHWLLADFDDAKIATFLDNWTIGAIREPGDRTIVRKRIRDALRSPVIRELAGNPLLLTLMAVLARKSDLPRDLGSLYAKASDLLLEHWDTHRMLASDVQLGSVLIDQKDKHDLLRQLAWEMQTGQRGLQGNLISEGKVRAAMDASFQHRLPDPGLRRKAITLIIEQLTERNYILCHVGGAQFAFVHRGFLEFFASEHLLNIVATKPERALDEIGTIYHEHARDGSWREVLILDATRFDPAVADKILAPLGDGRPGVGYTACLGQPHPFVLACAVLARAREPKKLIVTYAQTRLALQQWLAADPKHFFADAWVRLLADSFADEASRLLLSELAKRNDDIPAQRQAITSLGEKLPVDETRVLLIDVAKHGSGESRILAISSLGEHFSPELTRPVLEELARCDNDNRVHTEAIKMLLRNFSDEPMQAFLEHLVWIKGFRGQEAIRHLVERFPNERTQAFLEEIARKGDNNPHREDALDRLISGYRDERTRNLFEELALEGDEWVREKAVSSLIEHYLDDQTRIFLEKLASEEGAYRPAKAMKLLVQHYGDERTRIVLEKVAHQKHSNLAVSALQLLGRHYLDRQLRTLLEEVARQTSYSPSRETAVDLLLDHFLDERTRRLLEELSRGSTEEATREKVISGLLSHFPDEKTRVFLEEYTKTADSKGRNIALAGLVRQYRDDRTSKFLERLVRKGSDCVAQLAALDSLLVLHFEDDQARALLFDLALVDEKTAIRSRAVRDLVWHFRDSPETTKVMQRVAMHPHGRTILKECAKAFAWQPSVTEYLRTILKS